MASLALKVIFTLLVQAKEKVEVGGFYTHYKNPDYVYQVSDIAVSTNKSIGEHIVVIYSGFNEGKKGPVTWTRALEDFLSEVEVDGTMVPKFSKVSPPTKNIRLEIQSS